MSTKYADYLRSTAASIDAAREHEAQKRAPVPPASRFVPPTDRGRAIARVEMDKIRAVLGNAKGQPVAGTFHHVAGNSDMDPKLWAKKLRIKEQLGEHLSPMQREAWRDALGLPHNSPALVEEGGDGHGEEQSTSEAR